MSNLFLDRATIWAKKPWRVKFWSENIMAGKKCLKSRHFINKTKILQVNFSTKMLGRHLKIPWRAQKSPGH
jgi:hypothetical protein